MLYHLDEPVTFRSIRPDDVPRLQAFHRRLSPTVVRLRFHGYLKELPDALAHRFCEVDGCDRVAIVAVTSTPEQIVGVGRFDRSGDCAELALVVEDRYQGHGIGMSLLHQLLDLARKRGIRTLMARVIPGNSGMRHLLERTGLEIRVERDRDAVVLWLTLDHPDPA